MMVTSNGWIFPNWLFCHQTAPENPRLTSDKLVWIIAPVPGSTISTCAVLEQLFSLGCPNDKTLKFIVKHRWSQGWRQHTLTARPYQLPLGYTWPCDPSTLAPPQRSVLDCCTSVSELLSTKDKNRKKEGEWERGREEGKRERERKRGSGR